MEMGDTIGPLFSAKPTLRGLSEASADPLGRPAHRRSAPDVADCQGVDLALRNLPSLADQHRDREEWEDFVPVEMCAKAGAQSCA